MWRLQCGILWVFAVSSVCRIEDLSKEKRIIINFCVRYRSEVYAADMFASFFAADPRDASQGRKYRHGLLEKGGSRPEMEPARFSGKGAKPRGILQLFRYQLGGWMPTSTFLVAEGRTLYESSV